MLSLPYHRLVNELTSNGLDINGRSTTFGAQLRFDLKSGYIPLVTGDADEWKHIVVELLWMLSGYTDATCLTEHGIHSLAKYASREYLDQHGLSYLPDGDLGPVDGFQLRHFGAYYTNCHADYYSQGVDQIKHLIDALQQREHSDMIICTWNPADLPHMARKPRTILAQFFERDGVVSCQVYQSSIDVHNIPHVVASYSLLLYMVCQVCNLSPGTFIYTIGEVYTTPGQSHTNSVFCETATLKFGRQVGSIDDFEIDDIMIQRS